jgi:hypothetical protein
MTALPSDQSLKYFTGLQTDNILSLVDEGLLNEVTELMLEYSKTLLPPGKLLYALFQKLSKIEKEPKNTIGNFTDLVKLQDFLFRNLKEFHQSFRDYIKQFKKDIYQIIQDKIGTSESRWIRENLMLEYTTDKENSLVVGFNGKNFMMYLKSIWKKSRFQMDIVNWIEFIGFMALNGSDYGFLDQTDSFIACLDSDEIIDFSNLIQNMDFKRIIFDSYLQGISNIRGLQEEFDLEKILLYLKKAKPYKKNAIIFSTVLGLLMVDWIQMNPNDLNEISKEVQDSVDLPQVMAPLFTQTLKNGFRTQERKLH